MADSHETIPRCKLTLDSVHDFSQKAGKSPHLALHWDGSKNGALLSKSLMELTDKNAYLALQGERQMWTISFSQNRQPPTSHPPLVYSVKATVILTNLILERHLVLY